MGSFVITFFVALLASVFCERTIVFIKEVVMGENGQKKVQEEKNPTPALNGFEVRSLFCFVTGDFCKYEFLRSLLDRDSTFEAREAQFMSNSTLCSLKCVYPLHRTYFVPVST